MQTVFLDACTIIYLIEANEPWYSDFQEKLRSLQQQHGEIRLAVSELSYIECLVKPLHDKNTSAVRLYEKFFAHPELLIQPLSSIVVQRALRLRVDYKLKTPDALQAASALVLNKQCIFLTADKGFAIVNDLSVELL